ncbi:MAG: hypothetical protein K0R57_2681 [Paenibacillaceae bacterium]|nr:hypothetical protein [Paenibacillaceae bacterium]
MYKVIIVDDEILVRVGLKTFIPWERLGLELVGEAGNGREALELVESEGCDILLTDIQMPEMDGLALLEAVTAERPRTKIIMLTNHEEFRYVRRALQLGAADYLLKLTMEPLELERKLSDLKEKIVQERSQQRREQELKREIRTYSRAAREKSFRDVLTKSCSPAEIRECLSSFGYLGAGPFHVALIRISHYERVLEENKYNSEQLLAYTVLNILQEILKKQSSGELIELENGCFALFSAFQPNRLLLEMSESVKQYLRLDLCLGVSAPCQDERLIRHAYEQAQLALELAFFDGPGRVFSYEQVSCWEKEEAGRLSIPHEQWKRLVDERNLEEVLKALGGWVDELRSKRCRHPERIKESVIQLIHHLSGLLPESEGDIYSIPRYRDLYPYHAVRSAETLDELHEWIEGWLSLFTDYLREQGRHRYRPEIREVIRIIREKFDTALKVSDLARESGFNEAYLSTLFKKETGESVMDMIIRLRMAKARGLLLEPGMKIYEVAEAIGYTDANYFAKLFKKIEGIHPQEYRRRRSGSEK